MDRKLKVLAVGAHPDDIELYMMGTLAKYKEQGHDVHIVVATDGQRGGFLNPNKLTKVRREEAVAAAAHIGVTPVFLGLEDGRLLYDRNARNKVEDLLFNLKPDVVFTHDPNDYHADHRTLSNLVTDACWAPLFYADTMAGVGFTPEFYVDISKQFPIKKKAILAHASQQNISILEMIELQNRFRGMQCEWGLRVRYAEAFRLYPRIQFVTGYTLLPK